MLAFQRLEYSPYKSIVETIYSEAVAEGKNLGARGENGGIWVAAAELNGKARPELIIRFHTNFDCGMQLCWNTVLSFKNGAWVEHGGLLALPTCAVELTNQRDANGLRDLKICDGML